MRRLAMIASLSILAAMLGASLLNVGDFISGETNRAVMQAGTILWFVVAPVWLLPSRAVSGS